MSATPPSESGTVESRPTEPKDRWYTVARVWQAVIALVVLVSFLTQFVLNTIGGQDANTGEPMAAVPAHIWLVRMFSYFTIQSNLLTLIASVTLVLNPRRDGRFWRVLRLDAMLGIVITGLVFDIVLAPDVHLTGVAYAVTVGFHYFSPWVSLLGWLLFGPRPRIDWRTVALAFIWPVAWIVYTFVHGAASGWYPYPFLNVREVGFPIALRNTAIVLIVGLVVAVLFKLADRLPVLGSPALSDRTPASQTSGESRQELGAAPAHRDAADGQREDRAGPRHPHADQRDQ